MDDARANSEGSVVSLCSRDLANPIYYFVLLALLDALLALPYAEHSAGPDMPARRVPI